MPYTVDIKPSALREMRNLPIEVRRRVDEAILGLETNPRPPGSAKLAGFRDHCRIRVGDYRIAYQVRDRILLVLVVRVGHRRDVYRGM
ncbi:MAG: type II toxin-antitoxin system RelE/ParE family toxin [Deltaproteobacteria bacterium]|nr:type II toxin-antitoxin system RelE/ParE family toxin [Deltaproteobacteria bacterium]